MNAGGYVYTLPPATASPPAATNTAMTASTSTPPASANPASRRRDHTPTGTGVPSASAFSSTARERFTRGLSERLRVFQGSASAPAANPTTATQVNTEASASSSSSSVVAPVAGSVDASRPRAWERLFGRDAQPGGAPVNGADTNGSTSTAGAPNTLAEETADLSHRTAEASNGMRGYSSVGSRSTSQQGRSTQNQGQGQTDLSGMVRNNLVLAQQQQQSTSAALAGQWWRVAGSGSGPGAPGANDMGVD